MQQRDVTELASEVLRLSEQRRFLDIQIENRKDELAAQLRNEGVAELVVPTDVPDFSFHIKMNLRFTKKFDKEGLSAEIARDKEELDYHGITKLVEDGHLKSAVVAKFQSDNQSKFVSVRRKKTLGGKK